MVKSLLYVSTSEIRPPLIFHEQVLDIVTASRLKNAVAGVTGTLICTTRGFAQILEGEERILQALLEVIKRDPRHSGVNVLDVRDIRRRRFQQWTLAYSGPASYLARHVDPLLDTVRVDPLAVSRLRSLLEQFGRSDEPVSALP
jgi:hypothetical protein